MAFQNPVYFVTNFCNIIRTTMRAGVKLNK
jgi:hypothetical protein